MVESHDDSIARWFQDLTGIPCTVQDKVIAPAHYLCFLDGDGQELLRVPQQYAETRELFASILPPHLNGDSLDETRKEILGFLVGSPTLLQECANHLPVVHLLLERVRRGAIAQDRLGQRPDAVVLESEVLRQKQVIVFGVDDVTAEQMLRIARGHT